MTDSGPSQMQRYRGEHKQFGHRDLHAGLLRWTGREAATSGSCGSG